MGKLHLNILVFLLKISLRHCLQILSRKSALQSTDLLETVMLNECGSQLPKRTNLSGSLFDYS